MPDVDMHMFCDSSIYVNVICAMMALSMIFVTQTNPGTLVKSVPQEQMVGIRSYPSRELFFPFSGFFKLLSLRDVLNFKFP